MKVIVSDDWYASPEHDKERFAEAMGDSVKGIIWSIGLQEAGDPILVHIYDSHDKRVAKQSLVTGNYKIEK